VVDFMVAVIKRHLDHPTATAWRNSSQISIAAGARRDMAPETTAHASPLSPNPTGSPQTVLTLDSAVTVIN
jgi:hypothetical protein